MNPAKIVLVDDNIADVKLLRLALDGEGARYELQVLPTGDEALRFVRSNHSDTARPDPCVIVLDLNMPRYDGLEILEEIKRSPELAHVSVVVLSGVASPLQRQRIAQLGAVYMQKPSDLAAYLALGAKILEICNHGAAAF